MPPLSEFMQLVGTIGVGAAGMFGLMYLERLRLANQSKEVDQDLEDTKVKLSDSTTIQILAQALTGLRDGLADIGAALKKGSETDERIANLLFGNQGMIEDIHKAEGHITTHMTNIIAPYQDIHAGHTRNLLSIIETGKVLVESVEGLRTQNEQQSRALDAILETVKLLAEDTAELNIVKLASDNHKETVSNE